MASESHRRSAISIYLVDATVILPTFGTKADRRSNYIRDTFRGPRTERHARLWSLRHGIRALSAAPDAAAAAFLAPTGPGAQLL